MRNLVLVSQFERFLYFLSLICPTNIVYYRITKTRKFMCWSRKRMFYLACYALRYISKDVSLKFVAHLLLEILYWNGQLVWTPALGLYLCVGDCVQRELSPTFLRRRHQRQTLAFLLPLASIHSLCIHSPDGVILSKRQSHIRCVVPRLTLSVISLHTCPALGVYLSLTPSLPLSLRPPPSLPPSLPAASLPPSSDITNSLSFPA